MSRRWILALVALLALSAGCVSLPEEGQVNVGAEAEGNEPSAGFPYQPRPPQEGEAPAEIVRHFLDAMTANPISTAVARQFLTTEAREAWRPDQAMITYADLTTPLGGARVEVNLLGANHLDERGSWQGPLGERDSRLEFGLATEGGEWRISELPDAMIVTDSWFRERYTQASLFFFDPGAQILVPEPVFVPRGSQTATALVNGLLRGPIVPGVTQSFVPRGLSVDFSVPVPADGVAEVALTGEAPALDPSSIELMTAQLAQTLRQDPSIQRFRVTLNGTPITDSGTQTDVDVSVGDLVGPSAPDSWPGVVGLRRNRLVTVAESDEEETAGPFGQGARALRSLAVDLPGESVAGVSADGRTLWLAPLDRDGAAVPVLGGNDLLKPAWDHSGALWSLDRRRQGAELRVTRDGRSQEVRVPGVSGERVVDFVVSRDGSRLVAIVAGPRDDRVVVSRLGRVRNRVTASAARPVWQEPGERLDLKALAWRTPTEVLVARAIAENLTQVTRRSVDGSAVVTQGDVGSELVRDRIRRLISSPRSGQPAWAVGRGGQLHVVASREETFLPSIELTALTYVG